MATPSSDTAAPKHTNRLAQSTSPYLLQHAHNPVDWYPWGDEAIAAARAQDKPIFLSVGYSTCYWCHVMERQCFEVEAIAQQMNERFINVKVDREERPDVDQLYMIAVQVLTRQGGWPMSVFLTPGLKPFFGGTYFPPEDGHGRPGFPRVLNSISATYASKKEQVERSADEIVRVLQRVAEPRPPAEPLRVDATWVESLIERSTAEYEPCYGGFGSAPKFPRETLLEMLLAYTASPEATEDAEGIRAQVLYTLDFMAEGGIHDQIGGGFHRYSTDERWLVPHFEIMSYDNAMLAVCYAQAWRQTKNANYATVARGICDFVLREMTGPAGEFYTALDAEVDGQEGLNYLWTLDEVREVLGEGSEFRVQGSGNAGTEKGTGAFSPSLNPEPRTLTPSEPRTLNPSEPRTPNPRFSPDDVDLFARVYGLSAGPNFADPHHGTGQPDKNILHLPTPLANIAKSMGTTEDALDARLEPMRQALKSARDQRKQPLLDTKILTSWNALMIRAMAIVGEALAEPRYVQAAERAAHFLLTHHRLADGSLIRTSRPAATRPPGSPSPHRPTSPSIPAFLDDYAFLAHALVALHKATGDAAWRHRALRIAETMNTKFRDRAVGGFYFTPADATDLIVRQKVGADSPLPSGNAAAAMALLELGASDTARETIAVFAQALEDSAEGMSSLVHAALLYLQHREPFTVSSAEQDDRPPTPDQLAKSAVELSADWQSPTELRVTVRVLDTFHLNASRAAQGMIPTTLAFTTPPGRGGPEVQPQIDYPPGEARRFAFTTEPLHVYAGDVTLLARFAAPPPPGTSLRAVLTYQPCTDDACLPATSKVLDVDVA